MTGEIKTQPLMTDRIQYPPLYGGEINGVVLSDPLLLGSDQRHGRSHKVEIPPGERILPISVPPQHLFGTQGLDCYSAKKLRVVDNYLQTYGYSYLEANPVLCALLDTNNLSYLAVIDGHSKARRATHHFGDVPIPTITVTPQTAAKLYYGDNTEICTVDLFGCIWSTLKEFEPRLIRAGKSLPVPLTGSVAEQLYFALYQNQSVSPAEVG